MLVLDIFYEGVFGAGMLGGLYASITIILLVALLRIAYAVFLEDGHRKTGSTLPASGRREIDGAVNTAALPPSTETYNADFDPQSMDTVEMPQPRSVTENTTTKLETIE